jgi:predicted GNAT superfamily acetyltransferase
MIWNEPGPSPVQFKIRDIEPSDLNEVLALNNAAVPHVNALPLEELDRFRSVAAYFRVAQADTPVLGFLVAFLPGADYGSENYQWFLAGYDDFIYIDRIVVAPTAAGQGIAKALYRDLASALTGKATAMTCEVNIRPPNKPSTEMHRRLGFVEIGQREADGGAKLVSLLRQEL